MIWRGLDGVPRAAPVPEAIHPDPGKLSADRIGIFPAASRPSGDQPLDAWMALNIHVLPQAGVFIGVYVVTEAPVEVHRHASRVVAATGRAGGADLALKLLPIVEAEHQSVFAQKWNRRCGRRAASPRSFAAAAGRAASANGPGGGGLGRGLVPAIGRRRDACQSGRRAGPGQARAGRRHHPYPASVAAARHCVGWVAAGMGPARTGRRHRAARCRACRRRRGRACRTPQRVRCCARRSVLRRDALRSCRARGRRARSRRAARRGRCLGGAFRVLPGGAAARARPRGRCPHHQRA